MQFLLILALVIAFLAVVFAIQNTIPITITFFAWKYESSLALILLLALALGVIISFLMSAPAMIKKSLKISSQKKRIEEMEKAIQDKEESQGLPPNL